MQHSVVNTGDDPAQTLTRLTAAATGLGHETVEISAFLAQLEDECSAQALSLGDLDGHSGRLSANTETMMAAVTRMSQACDSALQKVQASGEFIVKGTQYSSAVAEWVNSIHGQSDTVREMLTAIELSNSQIFDISAQVNILAVNAKIEAARAGQAGKGFSIVADAVNELSQKTSLAADRISQTVVRLAEWLNSLQGGAERNAETASFILQVGTGTTDALKEIEDRVAQIGRDSHDLTNETRNARDTLDSLTPVMQGLGQFVSQAQHGVQEATRRCHTLVDSSEEILQDAVGLGGDGADSPMITLVQDLAGRIATVFENAVANGRVTLDQLFDATYRPIPGSDPQQVTTGFTTLTDAVLPGIQEPVLDVDPRIVFCAAVDRNGYLPTHNLKFGKPQSSDPVWNAGNCRNRRIFDDRVGLKAGRNEAPFLLQVYRRDMGGKTFVMMKDLSAPIRVQDRHWGGLRLAYTF